MKRILPLLILALLLPLLPCAAAEELDRRAISWQFFAYQEPDFTLPPRECFAPQNVILLQERDDGWAMIQTYLGSMWVYVEDNRRYISKRSCVYDTQEIKLLADVIEPQVVKVVAQDGDWLQIELPGGLKWLNLTDVTGLKGYTDIREIQNPSDILALCTQNRKLSADYVPQDLRKISGTSHYLRAEAAEAFERMKAAMKAEGLGISVASGYRSYTTQSNLYYSRVKQYSVEKTDLGTARPGHSEHQLGLAVDLTQKNGQALSNGFMNTKQYAWLMDHAHEYGYILRYPAEYTHITGYKYEPWHWRYIGPEAASAMKTEGYELFEFYCAQTL